MATLQNDNEDSRIAQMWKHCPEFCNVTLVCWRFTSNTGVCGFPGCRLTQRSQGTHLVTDFLLSIVNPSKRKRVQELATLQSPLWSVVLNWAGGGLGNCVDLCRRQESSQDLSWERSGFLSSLQGSV